MSFQEHMRILRKAMCMCQSSKKTAAVATVAALDVLMDICLSVHRRYERLGTLGENDERFKARMYLHLQHAVQQRVCYANTVALTVFEDATDPFIARLPGKAKPTPSPRKPGNKQQFGDSQYNKNQSPTSGCYLCTATDHLLLQRSKISPIGKW